MRDRDRRVIVERYSRGKSTRMIAAEFGERGSRRGEGSRFPSLIDVTALNPARTAAAWRGSRGHPPPLPRLTDP